VEDTSEGNFSEQTMFAPNESLYWLLILVIGYLTTIAIGWEQPNALKFIPAA
jgi:hypothetical protein